MTGDVTGDLTGNVTGNLTGNVTGDLTGNVTASSVTVNGVEVATEADITSLSSLITDNANDIILNFNRTI